MPRNIYLNCTAASCCDALAHPQPRPRPANAAHPPRGVADTLLFQAEAGLMSIVSEIATPPRAARMPQLLPLGPATLINRPCMHAIICHMLHLVHASPVHAPA